MGDITTNFSYWEFACPCGKCSLNGRHIDLKLVHALQRMRDVYGKSITVNSGCRCDAHNITVGGVTDSSHKLYKSLCRAADLDCNNSVDRYELVGLAIKEGLTIGTTHGLIHVDTRPIPKPFFFLY